MEPQGNTKYPNPPLAGLTGSGKQPAIQITATSSAGCQRSLGELGLCFETQHSSSRAARQVRDGQVGHALGFLEAPWRALATRKDSGTGPAPHPLIIPDILVSQAHEQLPEVMPLVALPPLHIRLQVSVEALHPVLALLHICWHLEGKQICGFEVPLVSLTVSSSSNIWGAKC